VLAEAVVPLLAVEGLVTRFVGRQGAVRAVDDVSFTVEAGRCLGLVGESGCGKSVTALSILRLLPSPPAEIAGGRVLLDGKDLLALPERGMRAVRGQEIAMVFQEPMTSLNPVYTVGWQIVEALQLHQSISRKQARDRAIELLRQVGIPSPEQNVDAYPHQLSGGMRQRVMIAIALSCNPKLLIADEPTTALDVTIQAQILALIDSLRESLGMGVVLITHDLAVVSEYAHRVVVMYAGRVVEEGPTEAVFRHPRMPYTQGLLRSLPKMSGTLGAVPRRSPLPTIEGMVPDLAALPPGCSFSDRCPHVQPRCRDAVPPLEVVADGDADTLHRVRCVRWQELAHG
jgi:peptide/nickel transport system ATP-binding protein